MNGIFTIFPMKTVNIRFPTPPLFWYGQKRVCWTLVRYQSFARDRPWLKRRNVFSATFFLSSLFHFLVRNQGIAFRDRKLSSLTMPDLATAIHDFTDWHPLRRKHKKDDCGEGSQGDAHNHPPTVSSSVSWKISEVRERQWERPTLFTLPCGQDEYDEPSRSPSGGHASWTTWPGCKRAIPHLTKSLRAGVASPPRKSGVLTVHDKEWLAGRAPALRRRPRLRDHPLHTDKGEQRLCSFTNNGASSILGPGAPIVHLLENHLLSSHPSSSLSSRLSSYLVAHQPRGPVSH